MRRQVLPCARLFNMMRIALFVVLLAYYVGVDAGTTTSVTALTDSAKSFKAVRGMLKETKLVALEKAKRIKVKEDILRHLDDCKDIENAGPYDLAVEVLKYKDFTTGPSNRQHRVDACYERLRPKVILALKKGYIKALQEPPCRHGWGSFNLYKSGQFRIFEINRRLPCLQLEHL